MTWFKVDDKLHDHEKPHTAGKAAMGVWVLAGSWSADNLTDGFVPARVLGRWGTAADAKRLVAAELWDECERDGQPGWRFHDWLEYQPSRTHVETRREEVRERKRRWREKVRRDGETGRFEAPKLQAMDGGAS